MAEVFCPDCRRPMVGPPEPLCRNPDHNEAAVLRDPLALAMIAAWLGVCPDQVPKNLRYHTCQATMDAWDRVAAAARELLLNSAINSASNFLMTKTSLDVCTVLDVEKAIHETVLPPLEEGA